MSHTTPQIEAILQELADMCCDAIAQNTGLDHHRVVELVRSLSVNGWERHSDDDAPLAVVIERRVSDCCQETAVHRGAELTALVNEISSHYESEKSMSANSPQ